MTDGDLDDGTDIFPVVDAYQIVDVKRTKQEDHHSADEVADGFLGGEAEHDRDDASAGQQRIQDGLCRNEQRQDRIEGDHTHDDLLDL